MRRRRALSTIETIMAILIMATAVTAVSQFSVAIARQQRLARQRVAAMQEAANVLESQLAKPDSDALAGEVAELSPVARKWLPQATARVDVTPQQGDAVPGERVVVTIEWSQTSDGPPQRMQLTGWRFASREAAP